MKNKDVKYEPSCKYCAHGRQSPIEGEILCAKMGIRLVDSSCKKFLYDPLKRQPKKQPALPKYEQEDFEL